MSMNLGTAIAYIDLDSSKFVHGMRGISSQLSTFNSATATTGQKMTAMGNVAKSVGGGLTKALTLPLAGAGLASLKVASDFEAGMSKVASLSGATGKDLKMLEQKAREMGASTKFSATEASEAMSYMALAGWDANEMAAGIEPTLKLAGAAGMDLARTSDIVTDTLSMFGLKAQDATKMTDMLAYTQAKSNTSVEQLGEALKYCGASANAMGYDIADTSALLGVFADSGLKGSIAGTTLNSMFRDMKKHAKGGAIAIGKTKVAITDANGNYRDMADILADVEKATKGMSQAQRDQALSSIWGTEAMKGVNIAMNTGTERLRSLEEGIRSSDGAAKKMYDTMQNNLKGSIDNMKSALEGAGIAIGNILMPAIKGLVDGITNLLTWFNNLDEGTQRVIVAIGATVAVIGPLLLAFGTILTMIPNMVAGWGILTGTLGTVGGAMTGVTGVAAGTTGALAGASGASGILAGASGALAGVLKGGLIGALVGVIAKIGESDTALGWLQEKFGSLGTIIGGVCEFIAGIWNLTFDNIVAKANLALDLIAAAIDGPGGATVKDAWNKYNKKMEEINNKAWDNLTLKTTRELSQQKNSVDKETKEAASKAKTNTDKMAKDMTDNAKKGAKGVGDGMKQTSKVVMDESGKIPKDVQNNMQKSVHAMRQAGSDIYNGMNTSFSKLASQGKAHFSNLYNGVTNSTSKMASKVIADWNRIRSALSSSITGHVNIQVHGVQAALNQINSVKNAARHSNLARIPSPSPFMSFMAMPANFMTMPTTNMYAQAYDMVRSDDIASYVTSQIPSSIKLDLDKGDKKKDKKVSTQPINVEVKIDKFVNETKESANEFADRVIERVIYKTQRERLAIGGVR